MIGHRFFQLLTFIVGSANFLLPQKLGFQWPGALGGIKTQKLLRIAADREHFLDKNLFDLTSIFDRIYDSFRYLHLTKEYINITKH